MAATVFAVSPSYATGITPRGIFIRSKAPSLLSLHHRSTAAVGGSTFQCQAKENSDQDAESGPAVNLREAIPEAKQELKAKGKTFWEALSFSGPGPERINGRLAMVGFVSAMAVELAAGEDLAAQLANGGVFWFAGAAALLSVASLVPLFRGVDAPDRSNAPMTAEAEIWNGRFAMLGLVALAVTEYVKGGPLV
ncbi:early light-induced protein 1, chloroplastic-like isoform X2 [Dendrobium catenatum]|uniref:Early light-induced protein 1, chloroplastic n=1 Tax=Dendrobium catenatum TaxID=906689 RepID=A0A2I0V6L4_9ASPA|nr:early light-induced protein 1, chloroplastic-like isoform X2 [Dendrobium catenatum]PKU59043.1 Early light-induced protein 1, chloroplastic [Dendrobium catenatum]